YLLFCVLVIRIDPPHVPFRGLESYYFDKVIILLCILAYTFLIFSVIDATMLCRRFIHRLIYSDPIWPFMQEGDEKQRSPALICRREWSAIKLIGKRTESISRLVYYPIFVALLLIASRSTYFDNWNLPVGLALVISASVLLVIGCAILLRRSARFARESALGKIRRQKEDLIQQDFQLDGGAVKHVEFYENQVANIRDGAFLPIPEQPWVKAITLLFGGGGSLLMLEYFSLMQ
ncbi:MAG: hypothetical protein R8K50_05895, partial [Mariprofundus sp.]